MYLCCKGKELASVKLNAPIFTKKNVGNLMESASNDLTINLNLWLVNLKPPNDGFNKALLRETNGSCKALIRPYFWGYVRAGLVDQP